MSYIEWANALRNIGENATLASKKSALRTVSQRIMTAGQNVELKVRLIAQNTLMNLDNPFAEGNERDRVDLDILMLKNALEENNNMMVEDGGRRRRRRTRKTKKRRITRRR